MKGGRREGGRKEGRGEEGREGGRKGGRKKGGRKEGEEKEGRKEGRGGREGVICTHGAILCVHSLITIGGAAAGPSSFDSGGCLLLFDCWPGLFIVAMGSCLCCQV